MVYSATWHGVRVAAKLVVSGTMDQLAMSAREAVLARAVRWELEEPHNCSLECKVLQIYFRELSSTACAGCVLV